MKFAIASCRYAGGAIVGSILLLSVLMPVWAKPAWSQAKVTHGPVVGAVTSESARIMVRTDAQAAVRFDLAMDSTFANSIATASAPAEPDSDYFVIIDMGGLSPNTKYYYRAVIDNAAQSDIRSFMMFPPAGTASDFVFAFGACQQAADDPKSYIGRVFPLIAQDNPRFFLQIGDWTYPDTTDTQANPTDFFNVDYNRVLASYRAKYDPTYPMDELLKVAPIDYVHDDHDFSNDNSDMSFPGRENSIRGYRAMFPHYPLANASNGLWHKFTFGNTDLFVVDTRTQRHPNILAFQQDSTGKFFFQPDVNHDILQADPTIAGELQMDWLIRELQQSTATWKFICTSVPFNPGFNRPAVELALLLQGTDLDPVPTPQGPLPAAFLAIEFSDKWGGFPESVKRLVTAVNEAEIQNVIMLSGDSHTAAIDDGAHSLFPEFMAGGLDRTNSLVVAIAESFGLRAWNRGGQTLQRNNFNSHYGRVTVFGNDSVRIELIDEFGELIASYTQLSGRVVSSVGLAVAPEGQDFGEVEVGKASVLPILFISTSADTVVVNNITSSSREFVPLNLLPIQIPPGKQVTVGVLFQPPAVGNYLALLNIESNDPESPFMIPLVGKGIVPAAVDDVPVATPSRYALMQSYPNPFNPATKIQYELPARERVSLKIYDMLGREVAVLVDEEKQAGRYEVVWQPTEASSGVYFYRLQAGDFVEAKKLILFK